MLGDFSCYTLFMSIIIAILAIYITLLAAWWIICAISSQNALKSRKRAHFNVTEFLDLGLMRFWRFVSYCVLAGLIIWLFLIGKWYFAILALFWNIKIYWFGSFFYLPFNIIESHYLARVELSFGKERARKNTKERGKQIEKMKQNNWTIPDKMK